MPCSPRLANPFRRSPRRVDSRDHRLRDSNRRRSSIATVAGAASPPRPGALRPRHAKVRRRPEVGVASRSRRREPGAVVITSPTHGSFWCGCFSFRFHCGQSVSSFLCAETFAGLSGWATSRSSFLPYHAGGGRRASGAEPHWAPGSAAGEK